MNMAFTGERYVPELRGQIYYEHLHRYMLAFGIARDLDVLDIACGEGYGSAYLAIVARGVIGVDIDPVSVRHAASRYTGMNLAFRVGSCTHIPIADQSVDLVTSFETIEHIDEHERFLSEIERVLRPDGRLIISAPNKLIYSDRSGYQNPYHVRELYFDEFRDLLCSHFEDVQLYGQRIVAGSAVHPLRGLAAEARWINPSGREIDQGLPALPEPAYFMAVCSRTSAGCIAPLASMFIDPGDDLLRDILQMEASVREIPAHLEEERRALDAPRVDEPAPLGARAEDTMPRATTDRDAALAAIAEHDVNREVLDGLLVAIIGTADDGANRFELGGRAHDRLGDLLRTQEVLNERIAERQNELAELRVRFGEVISEQDLASQRLHELESHLEAQSAEAARARLEVTEATGRLQALALTHADDLETQRRALQSRADAFASALEDHLEKLATEVAQSEELARAHDDVVAEVATIRLELQRTRAELIETRAVLDGIVGSKSWRITKPLRVTLRAMRRK